MKSTAATTISSRLFCRNFPILLEKTFVTTIRILFFSFFQDSWYSSFKTCLITKIHWPTHLPTTKRVCNIPTRKSSKERCLRCCGRAFRYHRPGLALGRLSRRLAGLMLNFVRPPFWWMAQVTGGRNLVHKDSEMGLHRWRYVWYMYDIICIYVYLYVYKSFI